jgi:hypothetical protein
MGKTQTLDELAMSKQYIVIQELIRSDQIPNDRVAQLINSYPDQARAGSERSLILLARSIEIIGGVVAGFGLQIFYWQCIEVGSEFFQITLESINFCIQLSDFCVLHFDGCRQFGVVDYQRSDLL